MSNMMGADLAQMQQLEAQFRSAVAQVSELQSQVDRALGNTQWTGQAATRFRDAWNSSFRSSLSQLREALDENARIVASRREAIDSATR